jgi:hypothetical protein
MEKHCGTSIYKNKWNADGYNVHELKDKKDYVDLKKKKEPKQWVYSVSFRLYETLKKANLICSDSLRPRVGMKSWL